MWTCKYREEVCCLEYYNPEYKDTILIGSGGAFTVKGQAFKCFLDAEKYIITKHKESIYPKPTEVYGIRDITASWYRIYSVDVALDNIKVDDFMGDYTINYSLKRWEEFKSEKKLEKIA